MHVLAYVYGLAYYAVLSLTYCAPSTLHFVSAWLAHAFGHSGPGTAELRLAQAGRVLQQRGFWRTTGLQAALQCGDRFLWLAVVRRSGSRACGLLRHSATKRVTPCMGGPPAAQRPSAAATQRAAFKHSTRSLPFFASLPACLESDAAVAPPGKRSKCTSVPELSVWHCGVARGVGPGRG